MGGATPRAALRAAAIYRTLTKGELLLTDDRAAEFVKLAENAFRDVNIAFANELSLICDELDLNVWEIIQLANHHPRVNMLQPARGGWALHRGGPLVHRGPGAEDGAPHSNRPRG
nr:hypothetical protein [Brevundimonas denitrificans]